MCSMSIILCYNMFKLFSSSFWHPSQSVDLSVNRRISRSNIFVVSIPKCLWFFIHSHTIYLIQCVQECRGNRYGYLFRVVSNTQKKGGVYLHIPFFTEERSNISVLQSFNDDDDRQRVDISRVATSNPFFSLELIIFANFIWHTSHNKYIFTQYTHFGVLPYQPHHHHQLVLLFPKPINNQPFGLQVVYVRLDKFFSRLSSVLLNST